MIKIYGGIFSALIKLGAVSLLAWALSFLKISRFSSARIFPSSDFRVCFLWL